MKKIKELVTLSGAIDAMCKGLRKQDEREDFKVDMSTFGRYISVNRVSGEDICYGCAATATIMEIGKEQLTAKNIDECSTRAKALGFEFEDLNTFEGSIDEFREGYEEQILTYFEIWRPSEELIAAISKIKEYPLLDGIWEENLCHYEVLAVTLKKLGY